MDETKVGAVQSWPRLCSARGLRGFLGLAGYYRRFIKEYGTIAAPLTQLLRKDGFRWTEAATAAFDGLKKALSTALCCTYRISPRGSPSTATRRARASVQSYIKAPGQSRSSADRSLRAISRSRRTSGSSSA